MLIYNASFIVFLIVVW